MNTCNVENCTNDGIVSHWISVDLRDCLSEGDRIRKGAQSIHALEVFFCADHANALENEKINQSISKAANTTSFIESTPTAKWGRHYK